MSDTTRLRLVHAAPTVAVNEQAGRELLGRPAEENHIVQFYEDDDFLCDTVAHFLGAGLIRGEPIVVFATAAHRAGLRERLLEKAFDVDRACAAGQITLLDADEMLGRFMVGGLPNARLFNESVGGVIETIRARRGPVRVRAFGEMVDLLWRRRNLEAALFLEVIWNDFGATYPISLLCAYVMADFYQEGGGSRCHDVCASHTHVLPSERFSTADDGDERFRALSRLPQRTSEPKSDIEERRERDQASRR